MIVTPRCFSAEVLRRGLRTFITSNVIWIKIRFPLFVITLPVHHFLSVVLAVSTLFAATASTFVELTIGDCGANHDGQTCPKHPESIINSCSSVLFQDWSSQFSVYRRFLLSSSENIQSPSSAHPIVFTWDKFGCCADVFEFGHQSSTCLLLSLSLIFLSPWISTVPCLYLEICSSTCTNNQMLCVHTFHSFDILHRIVSVLLLFLRNLCLSGFFSFLATFLALAGFFLAFFFLGVCIDFHWIFVRVCFWLKSSWRCVCSSSDLQSPRVMRWSFPVFQHSSEDVSSEARACSK